MKKLLVKSSDVDAAIDGLATAIIKDHRAGSPLFVALLRGAAPFASKLMYAMSTKAPKFHPELDYMMVSTYGTGRRAGEPHIVTDLAPNTKVKGRSVIIIDDVLDKGITANFVTNHLLNRGAATVQLAVLVTKQTKRKYDITADYSCFDLPDEWLVGMGMDNGSSGVEHYRWDSNISKMI